MNGYTESDAKVEERWSRRTFEAAKLETCLRQTTEADADKLHELIVTCDTDPAHILNAQQEPDWNEKSVTVTNDGTEPSPYISGGEVTYYQPYKPAIGGDEHPF
jgi:hypothetical protein